MWQVCKNQWCNNVPPDLLEEMKTTYYQAHILVDSKTREKIAKSTRDQRTAMDSNAEQLWHAKRRKRVTASRAEGIAKMRKSTKRANKVEEMLYSKFRGNTNTTYGIANEEA